MSPKHTPEERLADLGLSLPPPPAPGGNYVSAKRVGSVIYLAGVVSSGPQGVITGVAGLDSNIEAGYAAARACALTQLSVLKRELGTLDSIAEILTVNGYVNSIPGFADSPAVITGHPICS